MWIGGSWRQTKMKSVAASKLRAHASRLISSNASGNPSSDAVSISDAIRTQGDNAHESLRQYRTRLNESLVVQVLSLLRNPESGVKFFIWAGRQVGYSHTAPVYEALLNTLRPPDDLLLEEVKRDDPQVLGRVLNLMVRKHCRNGLRDEAVEELSRLKAHGLRPSAATYSALVQVLARTGRLGEAELIRGEMSALGLRLDEAALGCLASALCRAEKWREALDLVPAPDTVLFTKMVAGLCEASLFDDAMDFLDRMRSSSCFPNAVTYKVLLGACLRKRKLGRCKRVLNMMISEGCYPHRKLFESLVFAFCASGDYKFAYSLLRKMETSGSRPGFVVYNIFIGGVCAREESPSSDLLDLAEKAYGEMLESGIVLNKVNVVNFARCLCQVGRFERAHGVVSDMMRKGFVPDTSTYSKVIGFMCSFSELEKALFLFEEMKANGVAPGVYTYTILIDSFCKAGLIQQGRKLFDEMLGNGCSPNVVTYTALIHAYLKHRKVSDANKLFGMMLKDGCAPNIVTYTALIDGHFKARQPKKAVQIYEIIGGNGVDSPNMDIYFKPDGSESNRPDVFTYGAVVDGLCKAHRVEEAGNLLDFMTERGCEPNSIVYDALIDGFCKSGKIDEAEKVFSKMSDKGYSPTMFTYGSLIDGLFKCKRLDLVLKVLSKMEENSCQPNVVIYTQMVDGLCKVGKLAEASKLMLKMKEKNCDPNVVTYTAMMDGFGRAGQVEKSLALLREMCSKGCAPNFVTYRVLITHCCTTGLLEEARELLREMKQTYWPKHMVSYQKVIESYSRDFLASLGILHEISNYESVPMLSMYSILIEKYLEEERLEVALELYAEISSSTRLSKNMYTLLIESMSKGGELGKGFELFADMLSRGEVPELTTLVHLIKGLVRVDRWDDAFRLTRSICYTCF